MFWYLNLLGIFQAAWVYILCVATLHEDQIVPGQFHKNGLLYSKLVDDVKYRPYEGLQYVIENF
jgi:hypothetical protein